MSENAERKEKFTPGPWVEGWNGGLTGPRCAFTVFLDGQGRRLDYRVVSGPDMRLVCIIPDGEHAEGNEGNDAALIAAAPDMYAELDRVAKRPADIVEMLRREGFVFDNLDDRWQKLAFSLYTAIVELGSESENLMASARGES